MLVLGTKALAVVEVVAANAKKTKAFFMLLIGMRMMIADVALTKSKT